MTSFAFKKSSFPIHTICSHHSWQHLRLFSYFACMYLFVGTDILRPVVSWLLLLALNQDFQLRPNANSVPRCWLQYHHARQTKQSGLCTVALCYIKDLMAVSLSLNCCKDPRQWTAVELTRWRRRVGWDGIPPSPGTLPVPGFGGNRLVKKKLSQIKM